MPSLPQQKTSETNLTAMPFASYAQVVRMLIPPAYRVGFYDCRGRTLWVNEGIEEPEFRMHLDLVIARFASSRPDESEDSYSASELPEPIFVFPIRDPARKLIGVVGMLCRELPAGAAYRRSEHVEHLLGPMLEIIAHAWRAQAQSVPLLTRETKTNPLVAAVEKADPPSPLPALLRRVLALATRSSGGVFGAIIAADRPFTLNHRVSPEESDLAINAAVDNVRAHVLQWMKARSGPLISNAAGSGRSQQLPYKLLALPLRAAPSQLAAVIMIFRDKNAPDFGSSDLAALSQILGQLPATSLRELLAPPRPVQAIAPTQQIELKSAVLPKAEPTVTPAAQQPQIMNAGPVAPASLQDRSNRTVAKSPHPVALTSLEIQRREVMRGATSMDERIRIALRENCFDLYVQKISPLRDTQRGDRFEVLLRMNDGEALHSPKAFFPTAEANELMPELDEWVVRKLMSTLRQHAAALRTKCWEFAINIAAQSLLTDRFSEYVLQEIAKSSIPSGLLVFEISEGDAIEHQYSLGLLASRLHQAGCRIALDNCRGGLRTFDSVRKWPVSCVKIDGSVIRNVATNCRYESQVRAVAKMATEMGIETVAECVESESTHDLLRQLGIDYAQGFHLGKPQPLATLFKPAAE